MDMTTGPLFKMLLTYSLPVIAMGVLQCLYNAADMVVAGKFAGSQALAAVGSTGSLVNLVVALFIGISLGVNVTVAARGISTPWPIRCIPQCCSA